MATYSKHKLWQKAAHDHQSYVIIVYVIIDWATATPTVNDHCHHHSNCPCNYSIVVG